MSVSSITEADEVITWDQFPINEVFIHDYTFCMKVSAEDILRVRPTDANSWMGYGTTFKYDPSWNISFEKVGTVKSSEVLQKDLYHEMKPRTLVLWASVALSLISFAIWWLFR